MPIYGNTYIWLEFNLIYGKYIENYKSEFLYLL